MYQVKVQWDEWVAFLWPADSEIHIVHISRVIIAYALESLSFLTQITHNLQATIYFKKKDVKNSGIWKQIKSDMHYARTSLYHILRIKPVYCYK